MNKDQDCIYFPDQQTLSPDQSALTAMSSMRLAQEINDLAEQSFQKLAAAPQMTEQAFIDRAGEQVSQMLSRIPGLEVEIRQSDSHSQGTCLSYHMKIPPELLPEEAFEYVYDITCVKMRPGHYAKTLASLTEGQRTSASPAVRKALRGRFVHRHKGRPRRTGLSHQGHIVTILSFVAKTWRLKEGWTF